MSVGGGASLRARVLKGAGALALVGTLSACAVQTDPLTLEENVEIAQSDLVEMFAEQEPIEAPIGLYEAMARAITYNLDSRLRAMEEAFQQEQVDVAAFQLLPQVDANAGVVSRSNQDASSSENVQTGQESLAPSTSTETTRFTGDVGAVWNVLDFGVSYVSARQASDRAKIAMERRRKVIHDIIQDVRTAYWRAVASERLLARIDPLMQRVDRALSDSERIERLRLQSPVDALNYQRSLLDSMRQLQQLRRDLTLAKTELAALMNLPPQQDFTVQVPPVFEPTLVELEPEDIELLALTYRPELREERYQARISQQETRKALLRMLPGIEFDTALNFDTNSFLVNNTWASYGARITWNLFNLISGPARIDAAEAEEEVVEARRLALSMAVLVQAHVAWINYRNALEDYETADRLRDVDSRLLDQLEAQGNAATSGDLPVIRGELALLLSDLRRDLAYAQLNNAAGSILLSIGADPVPAAVPDASLDTLAAAIRDTEAAWRRGEFTVDTAEVEIAPADAQTGAVPARPADEAEPAPAELRLVPLPEPAPEAAPGTEPAPAALVSEGPAPARPAEAPSAAAASAEGAETFDAVFERSLRGQAAGG